MGDIEKRGEPKFQDMRNPSGRRGVSKTSQIPVYSRRRSPRLIRRGSTISSSTGIGTRASHSWSEPSSAGYLRGGNKKDVRFCLMWANHDWFNLMPARLHEQTKPLLYKGSYDAAEFETVTDYVISHYFSEPSYFTVEGEPYFSIYELKHMSRPHGGR